jgi:hypothetical protein
MYRVPQRVGLVEEWRRMMRRRDDACGLCGAGKLYRDGVARPPVAVVWVVGRGWVTDLCTGIVTSERLVDATWFSGQPDAYRAMDEAIRESEDVASYVVVTM